MFGRRTDDTRVADDRSTEQPNDHLHDDRSTGGDGHDRIAPETDKPAVDKQTAADRVANERATEDHVGNERAAEDRVAHERAAEDQYRHGTDATEPTDTISPTARRADTVAPTTRRADTIAPTTAPAGTDAAVAPDAQVRVRARTSFTATLALILGLSGLYAALSGRLAPVGLVLSVLGTLIAFGGLRSSRPAVADRRAIARAAGGRRISTSAVAGGGLSTFALVISLAGVVIAILALNHTSSWLDSDADQVSRARDWLNARWSWLERW